MDWKKEEKRKIEEISKMRREKNIKGLLRELDYGKSNIRKEVANALYYLKWKPNNTMEKAYYALGKGDYREIGSPEVEALLLIMKKSSREVRFDAIKLLGRIGDKKQHEETHIANY